MLITAGAIRRMDIPEMVGLSDVALVPDKLNIAPVISRLPKLKAVSNGTSKVLLRVCL
jgi:hypothetical protein